MTESKINEGVDYHKGVHVVNDVYQNIMYQGGSFFRLWESRVKDWTFILSETVPEATDQIIAERDGSYLLLKNARTQLAVPTLYAVFDHLDRNRALVLTDIPDGTCYSVVGFILDFADGKTHSKSIFCSDLFHFDRRNGSIGAGHIKRLVFVGNIVLWSWSHRDSFDVHLQGFILKEGNQLHIIYDSPIRFVPPSTFPLQGQPDELILKRWYCLKLEADTDVNVESYFFCVDSRSFSIPEPGYLQFDYVTIPHDEDVRQVLENLEDVPEYKLTERDGYPAYCISCGRETMEGSSSRECGLGITSSRGLGKAACPYCFLRFSISDKHWRCWKCAFQHEVFAPDYACDQKGDIDRIDVKDKPHNGQQRFNIVYLPE